jgi:putative flippase GtrA
MPDLAEALRFGRFALVGLASTGLYFGLLVALAGAIGRVWLLTMLCYAASMAFNYLAQARYTFRAGAASATRLRRYALMHAAAMALNSAAMTALAALGWPLLVAQVLVTGALTLGTFLTSRHWVFAPLPR